MRTALQLLVPFTLAITLPTFSASAQETTGRLEGYIVDSQGRPVANVEVLVAGPSLHAPRGVLTNHQGHFLVLALPVGEYSVALSRAPHATQVLRGVRIQLGQTASLGEVRLQEPVYKLAPLVVSGRPPLVDPTATVLGSNLGATEFSAIPTERDYRSIALLLPHVNESYLGDGITLAGATGLETRYFVDGIDVTDPVRSSGGTRLPCNFIKEVQVRTGGYEAEYRSSLGGTINVVTYSGSNETKGQLFGYFLNDQLAGASRRGALERDKGDFQRFDAGFGLSGPIQKKRLWYYVAYSPAVLLEDIDIPGIGFHEDKTTVHSFAGKLSWGSSKHSLILTAIGDPTTRSSVGAVRGAIVVPVSFANADPYLHDIRTGGVNLAMSGKHTLRHNAMLETSVSFALRKDKLVPATQRGRVDTLFIDQETGLWSGGNPDYFDENSAVFLAGLSGVWLMPSHEIKAGLEYKDNRWDFNQAMRALYRFADDYFFMFLAVTEGTVSTRVPAAFLQDSWRVSRRVRVNAGIRWTGEYIVASTGKVAQSIPNEWQPRLGVTYLPGEKGQQKVFASLGRYYEELPTYPLFFYYNQGTRWDWIAFDHDPRIDPSKGDTTGLSGEIQPRIQGLQGLYSDEITLGYELQVAESPPPRGFFGHLTGVA